MTTQTLSISPDSKIMIEHVGGDLTIEGWDRSEVETRGDDVLHSEQEGGMVISCDGDLGVSLPRAATLTVSYVGGDAKLENLNGKIEIAFVGGDAVLRNLTGHIAIGSSVGGEMKMENVSQISMSAGRGMPVDDLSAKIQRKVEAATRRAEKKIHEAERKMRRTEFISIEHKSRRGIPPIPPIPPVPPIPPREPKARHWNFGFDASGAPEASQPVSDDERLVILKMLQEKKITSEQAEKLLAALEGGS